MKGTNEIFPISTFVYDAGTITETVSPLFIEIVCNKAVPVTDRTAFEGNFITLPDVVVMVIRNPAQDFVSVVAVLCTYTEIIPFAVAVYVATVVSLLILDSVALIEYTTLFCSQSISVE